jgi:hypothetical protein
MFSLSDDWSCCTLKKEASPMNLNLGPDTEDRLRSLANANGVTVEDYLRTVLEEKSALAGSGRLTAEQWTVQFEDWADSFPDAPSIPDEALRRDSLYPDRH